MTPRTFRHLGACIAAAGTLVLLAPPAGATTIGGALQSGTLVVTNSQNSGQRLVDLADTGGGGEGCGGNGVLEADLTASTIEVTDLSASGEFAFGSGQFVAEIEDDPTVSVTGTVSGSSPATIAGLEVGFSVDISEVGEDCEPGELVCENLTVTMELSGSFSGNPASPTTGDTATLVGGDSMPVDSFYVCEAPFASYLGGHVDITGVDPLVVEVA